MKKNLGKIWLFGLVAIFLAASVLPNISANMNNKNNEILDIKPVQNSVFWEDNFDSYDEGSSMHGQGEWKGWDNDPTYTAYVSAAQSRSSPHSVDICADSDLVHEYVGCSSGQWTYTAWQYIPTDYVGQGDFILLDDYTDGAGQNNHWAVQLRLDGDQEIIEAEFDGFQLPMIKGQWVEIRVEIDLDSDWFEVYYDGDLFYEKAWTAGINNDNTGVLLIDAVDLWANSATSVFYDDMSLVGVATEPDLDCSGELSWPEVEVGATVTGSITVENVGAEGSELNWEIDSYPEWGTWTFNPDSGTGLTPEDGAITIEVSVVAPLDEETTFTGDVVIINTDDTDDTCTIGASLTTPLSQNLPFLEFIAERFPLIAKILGL